MPYCLRIAHLYPDLLNLYGDRGNLIAMMFRAKARNIQVDIEDLKIGSVFDPSSCDFFFIGGGQDQDQALLHRDFLEVKGPALKEAAENGLPGLCICGGYQLMGRYYRSLEEGDIEGLGYFDLHTEAGHQRMIGNLYGTSDFLKERGEDPLLIGFENHAGKTFLGPEAQPLARVIVGSGNNGDDGTEGCVRGHVLGTYMHGSLLPKNPQLTDWLLEQALQHRYPDFPGLEPIPNHWENAARDAMIRRLPKQGMELH